MTSKNYKYGRVFNRFKGAAGSFFDPLMDFCFPPHCLLCGVRLVNRKIQVCDECDKQLVRLEHPCADHNNLDIPKDQEIHFELVLSAFYYQGDLRHLVHLFKYWGETGLADYWSKQLLPIIQSNDQKWDFMIPVPLHPRRQKMRGYNQSELIAKSLSESSGIPLLKKGLKRSLHTTAQARKDRQERMNGLTGAFSVSNPLEISDKSILLVDDVVTTGSTVNECAFTLRQNGAKRVDIVSIARVEKLISAR